MNNAIKSLRMTVAIASMCAISLVTILRTNAAGSHLDHSFSLNGKLHTEFGSLFNPRLDQAHDVEVMSNGKVVVAGVSTHDFAVARYNSDGSLDTSFGGDGKVTTNLSSEDSGSVVAIQADGKIIVAGHALGSGTGADFAVLRYKTDGTLDTSFSNDGSVLIDFHGFIDYALGLAIQPDGKIVVVGLISPSAQSGNTNWGLARLNANGTLDTSFDGNGKRASDFQGSHDGARDVLVQSDGRIVVAGYGSDDQWGRRFAIARYNSNGAFDTTFGTDGKTMIAFSDTQRIGTANGLARTSSGKYILAGNSDASDGDDEVTVMRLTSSGTLDPTFDGDGIAINDQNPDEDDKASDVVLQPDGKIVATYTIFGQYAFGLLRYLSNGSLDPTFGTGGRVNTIFGTGDKMSAAALDYHPGPIGGDGKIVAAGHYLLGPDYDFAVARYTLSGIAATSDFSGDGIADYAYFRPSNGTWGWTDLVSHPTISLGQLGDVAVPGDYDGDGLTDAAVFRVNTWRIDVASSDHHAIVQFGLSGDKPVQGDYDGDGKTDIAVYRPSDGVWHLQRSSLGYISHAFGTSEDKPAPGDYDGDGLHDLATFRPSEGMWYLDRSTFGFTSFQFGVSEDVPVPGDYDGDTKTDAAVFRPSSATWYGIFSQSGEVFTIQFGISSDIPSPADFDGDGRTDVTVFRPSTGTWYVQPWNGSVTALSYGAAGDVPVPSAYKPQ